MNQISYTHIVSQNFTIEKTDEALLVDLDNRMINGLAVFISSFIVLYSISKEVKAVAS